MKFDFTLMNGIEFRSVSFSLKKRKYMLTSGWSLTKGDWWYRDDPKDKKFFDMERHDSGQLITYGIYIGRLGLCLVKDK